MPPAVASSPFVHAASSSLSSFLFLPEDFLLLVASMTKVAEKVPIEVPSEVTARQKAAAWAWYQRSAGRITQGGQSEAFAARYAAVRAPSRFRLEAEALQESEERHSFESSSNRKSFSSADGRNSMDLVSLDHSWDCGSSLFDCFELVTLSKQLDTGLTDPFIKPPGQSVSDIVSALDLDSPVEDLPPEVPKLPRLSMPVPRPVCRSAEIVTHAHEQGSFFDKFPYYSSRQEKFSSFEKHPIKGLHDIFPYHGPSGNIDKGMGFGKHRRQGKCYCEDGHCCHVKKQKSKNRVSFHGLSKALQHIVHLAHSGDHHHHREHHHHHNHLQFQEPSKALQQIRHSPHLRGDYTDSKLQHHYHQYQHKHVHHHHHHHYHYLFHSEDGFRLQPLDKSLLVAAAGLRTPMISPLPSPIPFEIPRIDGVDYK